MGTRSLIIAKFKDGKEYSVYCHWDGYPGNNGKKLLENYSSQELAEGLVSLGDMSSLQEKAIPDTGSPHSYDHPQEGVTVFYGRDRRETNVDKEEWTGESPDRGQEWEYRWDGIKWNYREADGEWEELTPEAYTKG